MSETTRTLGLAPAKVGIAPEQQRLLMAGIGGLLALVLLFIRAPDAFVNPQFWAEDGPMFWQQQATIGWRVLFDPYAGYPLFAPRLVALAASFFDPALAPKLFAWGAIAITVWSAATAATCMRDWRVGALLGVGLILTPIAWGEIFARVNMLQWVTAPTLALILTSPQQDRNKFAFAIVAAFTGPYSIFLAPVAAYQFWRGNNPSAAACLIAAGASVLFMLMALGDPGSVGAARSAATLADALHLASAMLPRIFNTDSPSIILGLTVLLFSIVTPDDNRTQRLMLLYFGAAVMLGTFFKYLGEPHAFDGPDAGGRYFYVPRLALIWCATFFLFSGPLWRRALSLAFIAAMVASGLPLQRDPLPDAHWAEKIRAGEKQIGISPPGWIVKVP
jgi:hypothetical protein